MGWHKYCFKIQFFSVFSPISGLFTIFHNFARKAGTFPPEGWGMIISMAGTSDIIWNRELLILLFVCFEFVCLTRSRTKQRQILTPYLFWKPCKLLSEKLIILSLHVQDSPGDISPPPLSSTCHQHVFTVLCCLVFVSIISAAIIPAMTASDILSLYSTLQASHTRNTRTIHLQIEYIVHFELQF